MNTEVMFSSKSNERATPQKFYDKLNDQYNFNLDSACNHINCKTMIWIYADDWRDGLLESWSIIEPYAIPKLMYLWFNSDQRSRVWCNPPYWRDLKHWVKKASEEIKQPYCDLIVMLIPARTDTKYFHEYIYNKENVEIQFIKWRLKFWWSKNPAPFPSMLVIFKKP